MSSRLRNLLLASAVLAVGMTTGWFSRGWKLGLDPGGNGAHGGGAVSAQAPKGRPASLVQFNDGKAGPQKSSSPALELLRKIDGAPSGMPIGGKFVADQFTAYLERHKRDAASLLAVWELTNDAGILREAYEKAPTDLLVGLHAFRSLPMSDEEKRSLVHQLRAAHPANVLGTVLAASLAAKQDDKTEFRALLNEIQQRPYLDLEMSARSLARREALMALRKSALEARIVAISRETGIPHQEIGAVQKAGMDEIKRLVDGGHTDEALGVSGQVLVLAQRVQEEPGRTAVADIVTLSVQASALRRLPEDVEIGDTGRTPQQQLTFLKSEMSSSIASNIKARTWHLQHLDEAGAELYFQIREQRGEHEAVKWAETYNGPAPTLEPAAK